MPASITPTISRDVATGRSMKGFEGLTVIRPTTNSSRLRRWDWRWDWGAHLTYVGLRPLQTEASLLRLPRSGPPQSNLAGLPRYCPRQNLPGWAGPPPCRRSPPDKQKTPEHHSESQLKE